MCQTRAVKGSGRRFLLLGIPILLVAGPGGWIGSDLLEQDNDFCNACHLPNGVPLHEQIRDDFDARPPPTLAAFHAGEPVESHPADPHFRCIDCHGGVGLVGRTRVKILAAKDAFFWAIGDYDEPDDMAWPLQDADCRKCHASFEVKAEAFDTPAFHDLPPHNNELGVNCVECHVSHETSVDAGHYFLDGPRVREECARCHSQFR